MNPAVTSNSDSLLVTFLASFLIWLMFAGLFYLWIFKKNFKREQFFHAFIASLIALTISEIIKNIFPNVRPFEATGETPLTITIPFDGAFPSAHASASFGLATGTWLHDKRNGLIFFISSILVSLGRVLGNVHYYSDVIAGAALGVASAFLVGELRIHKFLKTHS